MRGLILGAGMYVTGRGLDGPGTLLAALAQSAPTIGIEELTIVARSPSSADAVAEGLARLQSCGIATPNVEFVPVGDRPLTDAIPDLCGAKQFDFAVISLPDHLHFEALAALIRLAVPSLVVKPLVATVAEADALIELQQAGRVYCAVEFHKRWDESNLYAKRIIQSGELGRIAYVGVDYSQRIAMPTRAFVQWTDRTSIFQYLGVHYVDLIHFLTAARPLRLSAVGTRGVLESHGLTTYDSVHCLIEWSQPDGGRFVSTINTGWVDPDTSTAMSNQRVYFVGACGRLDCDQKHRGVEWVQAGKPSCQVNPYFSQVLPDLGGSRFRGYGMDSIAQFVTDVAALRDGRTTFEQLESSPRPTLSSARVSSSAIEAAHRSLDNGNQWIPLNG